MKDRPIRILLIEDNRADARLMQEYLADVRADGIELIHARTLRTALKKIHDEALDVILVGLGLSDSQGIDTFQSVQAAASDLPIVVLAGNDDTELAMEAVQVGAQDYLVKGEIGGGLLVRAMRYAIERKRVERELQSINEFNESLLMTIPLAMDIVDEEGTVLFINPAFEGAVGKDALGKRCWELYRDNHEQCPNCPLRQSINVGETASIETTHVLGGRSFEITHTGMLYQGKKAILEVFYDITERKRGELALRRISEQLLKAEEIAHMGFMEWNLKKDEIFHSDQVYEIFGLEKDEGLKNSSDLIQEVVHPDDRDLVRKNLELAIQGSQGCNIDHRIIRPDGRVVWVHTQAELTLDSQGSPETLLGTIVDITERKRAEQLVVALNLAGLAMEQALTPNEMFTAVTQELSRLGVSTMVLMSDESQRKLHARYLGFEPKAIEAYKEFQTLNRDEFFVYAKDIEAYRLAFEERRSVFVEDTRALMHQVLPRHLRKQAERGTKNLEYLSSIIAPISTSGRVIGLFSVLSEDLEESDVPVVTAFAQQMSAAWYRANMYEQAQEEIETRKQAESQLRESEEKYRSLFENIPDGIYRGTPDGQVVAANPALVRMLGYDSEEDLKGINIPEIYIDRQERNGFVTQIQEDGETVNVEIHLKRKDGQVITCLDNSRVVRGEDGETSFFEGTLTDITTRKRTEEALRASEEEMRALFAAMTDTVIVYDREGRYRKIATGNLDYQIAPTDEFIGKTSHDFFPQDQADRIFDLIGAVLETRQTKKIEYPLLIGDHNRWFAGVVSPLEKDTVIWVARDITDSKELQSRLEEQTDELRRRHAELSMLYEVGLTINSEVDPSVQMEILIKSAMKACGADYGEFVRYDQHMGRAELEIGLGYSQRVKDGLRELISDLGEGEGIIGSVAQERRPINIPDVNRDSRCSGVAPTIQSGLWVPVIHDDRLHGVLALLSKDLDAFSTDDIRLFVLFANQAAVALENANLYNTQERRATRMDEIGKLVLDLAKLKSEQEILKTMVDRAATVMQSSSCCVMMIDPNREEAVLTAQTGLPEGTNPNLCLPLDLPIIQHSLESGEPLILTDIDAEAPHLRSVLVHQDINALFVYPMIYGGQVIGFITFSKLKSYSPSEDEINASRLLAERVAVAVENAHLSEETERRMRQLVASRAIDAAITSSFSLDLTLGVLLEQLTDLLEVSAADILVLDPTTYALNYVVGRGFRSEALQHTNLRMGEGFAGQAAMERKIVMISDINSAPSDLEKSKDLPLEGFVGYVGVPLISKGKVQGVLEVFHREALHPSQDWQDFLELLAGQAAIAIDNGMLFENLQRSNSDLIMSYDKTLEGWATALELRDKETEGHTRRVADQAATLARTLGMDDGEIVHLRRGALLHDIGKMGVPDEIMLKPGPLSDEEWTIMRKHPQYAYDMLAPIPFLRKALDVPYCHHEKWDGSGYPRGLKGKEIPFGARIFAVIDVWDALTSDRPYRQAWSPTKALNHIRENVGRHFDPQVVGVFLEKIVPL